MTVSTQGEWHPRLLDPTNSRSDKPRLHGKTMIMDKGIGLYGFEDLLQTAGDYIDMIKIGFGTASLYQVDLLKAKIAMAKDYNICIYPGGTFLEVAVTQEIEEAFFEQIAGLGFTGVEVSDGTIELSRAKRSELIAQGLEFGLRVITEYGKKCWGSLLEIESLVETVHVDRQKGAELVTIEARESGAGVGIFDEKGECRDEQIEEVMQRIYDPSLLLWEAPQKNQQVHLLQLLGSEIHIGNVSPTDAMSLEALRRGLRSDTFVFNDKMLVK